MYMHILVLALLLVDARQPQSLTPAQEMAKYKAQVMSADYRADLTELARLRDELSKWPKERELAYLARYWAGFASWRIAINGGSRNMKPEELKANLLRAGEDFYKSIRLNDDFADAWVGAAGVSSWLPVFDMNGPNADMGAVRERVMLFYMLLDHAKSLDPENPRMLWIDAGPYMYLPPEKGGNIARGIEVYQRMLAAAERRGTDPASPLPDWGQPEALMSLAYAHSIQKPADLKTALDEANAALKLVPDWAYVKETLKPGIEKRLKEGS